jgi:hypothetical protein
VADTMRKCYGAQAKGSEKTLTKPGAARYTWTGTVGSVNELIRYLESNIPVGEKGGQIVTAHDVEFEKKVNGRKGNG